MKEARKKAKETGRSAVVRVPGVNEKGDAK